MRLSRYFIPTLKENPQEAQILSHRYMLRAGMIHQEAQGIYSWLPLGLRVLKKIENIIREEQNKAGALEVLMPTLQPADLWRESGRFDAYGKEMLRIKDRHERDLLYSPTNEEMITAIFRKFIRSYRDLPKMFYQIHWKFRDEIRPRFGVMRGREFLMKDNYSFDLTYEDAVNAYDLMYKTYLKTFKRLGVKVIPTQADSGPIGGDLSHEFCILAETGETTLYYDPIYDTLGSDVDHKDISELKKYYAATDEKHKPGDAPIPEEQLSVARGTEVGHIFYFGTKYSDVMNAKITNPKGEEVLAHMGSYGIGVSRLVGAIIDASHDDKGIIWPESVAPYRIGLINLRSGDANCDKISNDIYTQLTNNNEEVLYDDRDQRLGVKLADMELIGLPWQLIIGPKGIAQNTVELKCRKTSESQELSLESALNHVTKNKARAA